MQCQNCGSMEFDSMPNGSVRCRYCGNIIQGIGRPVPSGIERQFDNIGSNLQTGRKDKTLALLITFFFGWAGGQYFYYGNYVAGALNLLFCWTLIPCAWSFIYFFILLGMSEQEFNRKYNNPTRR